MAASASIVGWSRDSFWPQPSSYAVEHLHGNPLLTIPSASAQLAMPNTHQEQVAIGCGATLCDQEVTGSGTGPVEGGDYSLTAHEVIASRNSLYEVLETLGKTAEET